MEQKVIMSYHCEVERADRVQNIIQKIGMGQIIKKKFVKGCYTCITDTGIIIIKSADEKTIITIYVATARELVFLYEGRKKIPPFLLKRVDRNQSWFIKDGKTTFN